MELEYRSPAADELRAVVEANHAAFGEVLKEEDLDRLRTWMPLDRILAAWEGGRPVGVTASYPFELTVPGGTVPAAGVTWVGVLPSHRRRGVLRELMRRQLEDVRGRGEAVAILWASESSIYGRFGYGIAAPNTRLNAERGAFAFRDDPGPRGAVRLVDADEALERFPPLYERLRRDRPGLLSRSVDWWRLGKLADPEHWREETGPKFLALLELDGGPAGYAIYRLASKWDGDAGTPKGEVHVVEALAVSPEAARELWRFLFGIDLVVRVKSWSSDPAAPLLLMAVEPRRLHLSLADGLWLRFLDVGAALAARSYEPGEPVVLEVAGEGRFAVGAGAGPTDAQADVELGPGDLASAYLGAFGFERLALAGRARELRPGGLARASALFRTPLPPWCPEEF